MEAKNHKDKLKLIIIRLSALGDIVHTFPALRLLDSFAKENDIDLQIDFVTYSRFADLLKELNFINRIYELHNKSPKTYTELILTLQEENYDFAIDFQGLMKSAYFTWTLARRRFGLKKPREWLAGWFYSDKLNTGPVLASDQHVVDKQKDLMKFFIEKVFNQSYSLAKTNASIGSNAKKTIQNSSNSLYNLAK